MTRIPIWQLDAFTDDVFGGNPAAICPLETWLDDAVMQSLAAENNLSETAFLVPEGDGWRLRWFTPTVEVDLCGHATLATAWLLLHRLAPERDVVSFETRSGRLTVTRDGDALAMALPAIPAAPMDAPPALAGGLGVTPEETLRASNWLAVLKDEAAVRALDPDMAALATLHPYGVIVTAPGEQCDFVSRFFGPSFGIPEDPVTGSAHCTLAPYWAARLGRQRLSARQVSARGGTLTVEDRGDTVVLTGRCAVYLEGAIEI